MVQDHIASKRGHLIPNLNPTNLLIKTCVNFVLFSAYMHIQTCVHHTLPGMVMTAFSTVGLKKNLWGKLLYSAYIPLHLKKLRIHKFKRRPEDMVKKETVLGWV